MFWNLASSTFDMSTTSEPPASNTIWSYSSSGISGVEPFLASAILQSFLVGCIEQPLPHNYACDANSLSADGGQIRCISFMILDISGSSKEDPVKEAIRHWASNLGPPPPV